MMHRFRIGYGTSFMQLSQKVLSLKFIKIFLEGLVLDRKKKICL